MDEHLEPELDVESSSSSAGLGFVLAVIATVPCLFTKVPQILNLYRNKSARGVSLTSLVLEFWTYCTMIAYSFAHSYPIFSFAEYPFLAIQDIAQLVLVLEYTQSLTPIWLLYTALFLAAQFTIASYSIPEWAMIAVINASIPISASSKSLQLWKIVQSKDAGNVSPLSWTIGAITCAARMLTFILIVWDPALCISLSISFVLNCSVVCAALFFGKKLEKEE